MERFVHQQAQEASEKIEQLPSLCAVDLHLVINFIEKDNKLWQYMDSTKKTMCRYIEKSSIPKQKGIELPRIRQQVVEQ